MVMYLLQSGHRHGCGISACDKLVQVFPQSTTNIVVLKNPRKSTVPIIIIIIIAN